MDLLKVLSSFWSVIAAHPEGFILVSFAVAALAATVTHWIDRMVIDAARERLGAAREELGRTQGQKDELLMRLAKYGEDIDEIREQLTRVPRIHISNDPPAAPRDGDLWFKPPDERATARVPTDGGFAEDETEDEDEREEEVFGLDEDEEDVLKLLSDHEGLGDSDVATWLGMHPQRARHLCDKLLVKKMLRYDRLSVGAGIRYALTPAGREYLIEWDLLE